MPPGVFWTAADLGKRNEGSRFKTNHLACLAQSSCLRASIGCPNRPPKFGRRSVEASLPGQDGQLLHSGLGRTRVRIRPCDIDQHPLIARRTLGPRDHGFGSRATNPKPSRQQHTTVSFDVAGDKKVAPVSRHSTRRPVYAASRLAGPRMFVVSSSKWPRGSPAGFDR